MKRKEWLEIPQGKRTWKYRFFEILPAVLSYGMVILLVVLSIINPILAAIYLLIIEVASLIKAMGVAVRTVQGYEAMMNAKKVDWKKRCLELDSAHEKYEELKGVRQKEYEWEKHILNLKKIAALSEENARSRETKFRYPKYEDIYHVIIMAAYNEGVETIVPAMEAVTQNTFDMKRTIFVLTYEERGGEAIAKTAQEIEKRYGKKFLSFVATKHPDGLKGEIKGKGPNLCWGGEVAVKEVERLKIPIQNVILTSLDADNRMDRQYLDAVAYEFIAHEDRQNLSFQPISVFTNNIWDAAAPMRVVAVSNSFWNMIATMRPQALRNFASHSQPLLALSAMKFWSKRTIVEDGHQYWRSLFFFSGEYEVVPIRVPIGQDAVISGTLKETLKAQFIQLRRWDYGASDIAYVAEHLFKKNPDAPFSPTFLKFVRLIDGHVMQAALSPIIAFGGWVPMILNWSSRGIVVFNLPSVLSIVQTVAVVGIFVSILVSLKLLPPRPKKYRKIRRFAMVLQWILSPVIALAYTSAAAYYSQTRLLLGKYMEKFDVTKKVVK